MNEDDRLCRSFVALDAAAAADEPSKLVWVQIAHYGHFEGHAAGPFDLDAKAFTDIVRNFREVDQSRIAFDFEHSSCSPAHEGSIPTTGAPAQGWIHELKVDDRGLWAHVEWLEPARSYIREGKYRWVSPTIRFRARHPETGKDIGARLLSVALTNLPFLPSLAPLAAKNRDTESQAQDDEESMADAKELEAKNVDLTSKLSDSESKRAALEAKVAEASLRLNEVESKRSALEAENKLLRDWKTQREEGDLKSEVDTAFSTYKDSHRLTDAQRESMLVLARADLEAFRRLYPPVAPQQRHLLRDLSGGRVVEPPVRDDKPTLRTLTDKLMRERRLSFEEAQIAAARELGVRQLVAR